MRTDLFDSILSSYKIKWFRPDLYTQTYVFARDDKRLIVDGDKLGECDINLLIANIIYFFDHASPMEARINKLVPLPLRNLNKVKLEILKSVQEINPTTTVKRKLIIE